MNLKKTITLATLAIAAFFVTTVESKTASAQGSIALKKTYFVEVQYWFFDTDYYYWSKKLETTNQSDAQFLYSILLWAKENGQLNAVVPNSYWRYIAVDVRLRVEYNWNWIRPYELDLVPIGF